MKPSLAVAVAFALCFTAFASAQTQDEFETVTPRVKWRAEVGYSVGPVTIEGDYVLVGAYGAFHGGTMHCFSRSGAALWRADHAQREGIRSITQGIHSKPAVKDDRVYYYTNRGEIICADIRGFFDDENDGPFEEETAIGRPHVDIVWKVDLIKDYGVFKCDAGDIYNPHPSVLLDGDTLYCITSHGRKWDKDPNGKYFVNTPDAPSLVALDTATGALRWKHHANNPRIRRGQWGRPSLFKTATNEKRLAFSGGDAILYALDPAAGKVDWQTELEPADGQGFSSGHPCVWEDLLLVGLGEQCDDGRKFSIVAVTREGKLAWRFTHPDLEGCIGSLVVKDGVAFACSNIDDLFALDARTGALHTCRKTEFGGCFNSPVLVGDSLLMANQEGLYEFTADKSLTPKRYWDCGSLECDPVVVGDEILVANNHELICAEWGKAARNQRKDQP